MSNPWDVPPPENHGDTTEDDIHLAVGRALTCWEHVEETLARLFAVLTGSEHLGDTAPAIRVYGCVVSFAGRAEMLIEASRAFFHHNQGCQLEEAFIPLVEQCKGWSGRRNDLAHGKTGHVGVLGAGYFLFPGLFNTRKCPIGQPPRYRYTSQQIRAFAASFDDLYDQASVYANELAEWHRTRLAEPAARAPRRRSKKSRKSRKAP